MKKIILIIDANEETCEQASTLLQLEDYEVVITHDGQQGLNVIDQRPFQLVLCALALPDMSGYDVLKKITSNKLTSTIPVVLMSSEDSLQSFRYAMSNGAADYLAKPIKGEDLLSIVDVRLQRQLVNHSIQTIEEVVDDSSGKWQSIKQDHELLKNRSIKVLKAREVLFREGDYASTIYYMLSGKLATFKSTDCGRTYLTDICLQGDFLGYSAIFSSQLFLESAVAQEDSRLLIIPKNDFIDFLYKDKNVLRKFIFELSGKIHQAEQQLIKLAYNSARKRISDAILFVFEKYNKSKIPNIPIPFNRSMLSSLAAVSNECVSRNLTDFRNEGLIRLSKKGLFVIDFEKMKNIRN